MTTVLAAVDSSVASRPVLDVARALGASTGADVEALYVWEGDPWVTRVAAGALDVPLRIASGDPATAIEEALQTEAVSIGVLGRGGGHGAVGPLGHVTEAVVQRVTTPVVAVPPHAVVPVPGAALKVIVPVDGSDATAMAVTDAMRIIGRADVVAVHVHRLSTAPQYWDHYYSDYPAWCREFLRLWCNGVAVRIDARQGDAVSQILDVARAEGAALVALAWSQDLSPGRALVVSGILTATRLPVLLFPAQGSPEKARRPSVTYAGQPTSILVGR